MIAMIYVLILNKVEEIIGIDFVELSPIKNLSAPDFMVAKLIYKTIGYIFNYRGE